MRYDLVFEGGGAKGMVFVGACDEFLSRGHAFDRLLGTSAGAITAALLAVGYTSAEMLEALLEKEDGKSVFATFMGPPAPFTDDEIRVSAIRRLLSNIDFKFLFDSLERRLDDQIASVIAKNEHSRHVMALIERGGWFGADRFVKWLSAKLDSGTWRGEPRAFSGMTLAQLYGATDVELSVVASDTTDQKVLVLNHQTAPDCPLIWAVRMSMSIPLVWNEIVWRAEWGKYLNRDVTDHRIVDGGLISNFPIELLISDKPEVVKLMGPKKDNPVLGMLIDERLPVAAATRGFLVDVNVKPSELSTVQRLQRLVDTATGAHDKMIIEEYEYFVARLPAAGYGTTEFDMSDARRNALVEAGRQALASYLDQAAAAAKAIPRPRGPGIPSAADRIASRLLQ